MHNETVNIYVLPDLHNVEVRNCKMRSI